MERAAPVRGLFRFGARARPLAPFPGYAQAHPN